VATTDNLQVLFELSNETLSVEFKDWLDLSKSEGRGTLAKAAIALANNDGGTIIVGLREVKNGSAVSNSRPNGIPRYTPEAVNAAINKYADPHLDCNISHLIHPSTGHEHTFIIVPGGHTVPIMSAKDLPGTIMSQRCYTRKPGPKSEEPFTSEEWRALINRCVRNGRNDLLDAFRIIMQGHSLDTLSQAQIDELEEFRNESFGRWQSRVEKTEENAPARFNFGFYEQTYRLHDVTAAAGLTDLKSRMSSASEIKMTGWDPFAIIQRKPIAPVPAGDVIEAWLGHPDDGPADCAHSDFWRARPGGLFYGIRGFDEDCSQKIKAGTSIDLVMPIWRIGETLLYVARVAREFGDDPEISMSITYSGLMNRVMRNVFGGRYLSYDRQCIVDVISMRGRERASVIEENTSEVMVSLLRPLYEAFDFAPLSVDLISQELRKFRNHRY
jgi:hypothetical protein